MALLFHTFKTPWGCYMFDTNTNSEVDIMITDNEENSLIKEATFPIFNLAGCTPINAWLKCKQLLETATQQIEDELINSLLKKVL